MNEKIKEAFEENGFKIGIVDNEILVYCPFSNVYRPVAVLHTNCKTIILTDGYSELSFKQKNILTYLIQKQNDMLEYEGITRFD